MRGMGFVERAETAALLRRLDRRARVEHLLELARHLAGPERALVEAVYRDGQSVADYARRHRLTTRTAQHRLRTILMRLNSREFQSLVNRLPSFPRPLRAPARRLVLEGRGLRHTARLTGQSLHTVRRQHLQIQTLLTPAPGSAPVATRSRP